MRAPLLLNFESARQLDPRVIFTRSSGAARLGPGNSLIEVPTGGSRFQWASTSLLDGLLIEPGYTNRIRNSRLEGGAAPALPTNVTASTAMNGMTATLVARGTYLGRPYADIRLQGTPSATTSDVWFEANNQITASVSQRWLWYFEATISGGTTTNVEDIQPFVEERNSGTAFLSSRFGGVVVPSTTVPTAVGFSFSTTEATCFYLRPSIRFRWTATSVATDITYRIMLPICTQEDRRPFLTALAPVGAPAATTKAAESFITLLSDFGIPTPTELTALVSLRMPRAGTLAHTILTIDDGSTANRIDIGRSSTNYPVAEVFASSTSLGSATATATVGNGTITSIAVRATSTTLSLATSDGLIASSSLNAVPPGLGRLSVSGWTGTLKKIALWPYAVDDTDLKALVS